jgi:RNA polymerase sigma-70 factor, ECF subfamily
VITEEILKDFIAGKKQAFDAIYKAYCAAMFGICLRYTRCSDDAQDILQETFIKVYKNKAQYNPSKPLGAWIKTITIHEALNYIKKNYNRFTLTDQEGDFNEAVDLTFDSEDQQELKTKLLFLLNKLPDGYRTVFNLYTLDNLTHKEIAEHLEISEGTSKSQYFKAKKMIQALLAADKIQQ